MISYRCLSKTTFWLATSNTSTRTAEEQRPRVSGQFDASVASSPSFAFAVSRSARRPFKNGLRKPRDLTRNVLIHVTQQPRAWSQWLADIEERDLVPRGELWFDTVPAQHQRARLYRVRASLPIFLPIATPTSVELR
jgi:hypothetical protein